MNLLWYFLLSLPLVTGFSTISSTTTELPDSLTDASIRAAEATQTYPGVRCRIDFDTSVGDETYSVLKLSSEFGQAYVTALCTLLISGVEQARQDEMMRVGEARAVLRQLEQQEVDEGPSEERSKEMEEKMQIIRANGRVEGAPWTGQICRVFFPDEGNAALANRDWKDKVPSCCQFSSTQGVSTYDTSKDVIQIFFCPQAAEATEVEKLVMEAELAGTVSKLIFINPNLVDMGVTGFGMAGRLLRERLLDQLEQVYYLRTLPWGALTRQYPNAFSVFQQDENEADGYRLIKKLGYLPSNPEVEDIYDIENGLMQEKKSGGLLDQFGDFVNGMMKL